MRRVIYEKKIGGIMDYALAVGWEHNSGVHGIAGGFKELMPKGKENTLFYGLNNLRENNFNYS